jgi:plastocyanin
MRRTALVFALGFVAALVAVSGAASKTSRATFDVHVGDNFQPPLAQPSVARAANGDTITIVLTGTFNSAAKSASGSGTFVHMHGTTVLATGTLTLTRMIAFQFYGCGVAPNGSPFPNNFCGGRVLLAAHLVRHPASNPSATVERNGVFEVNCQVHSTTFSPPPGTSEGIKLVVKGGPNFNKHVSGANLLVQTASASKHSR